MWDSDKTFTQRRQRIPAWGLQITMNWYGLLPRKLSVLLLDSGQDTALLRAKCFGVLSCAMEGKEEAKGEPHFVGKREELIEAKHSIRTFEGRDVLVIFHQETFYAMDLHCYHAGGDLLNGDIEELGGKMCIICPNHQFKITLAGGEGLYKAVDPNMTPPGPRWFSKGQKQRTHAISEANGEVYVTLSQDSHWLDSDFFQGEKGKVERVKAKESEEKSKREMALKRAKKKQTS